MNEIEILLSSSKSSDNTKAAKILQKKYIRGYEELILKCLTYRYENNISWETQLELLKVIGNNKIKECLPIVTKIVDNNIDYDAVTIVAASAYLRLNRKNTHDVSAIINKYGEIGFSVGEGFLDVLGDDMVVPDIKAQQSILSYFLHFGEIRHRGLPDPRYGLVKACFKWDKLLTNELFEVCKKSTDARIIRLFV